MRYKTNPIAKALQKFTPRTEVLEYKRSNSKTKLNKILNQQEDD